KNMRSPTELTMEASVMKGVQNALQRARLRSSLASSKLFLGNGLSTMFRWCGISFYSFSMTHQVVSLSILLAYGEVQHASFVTKYYLSTQPNSITRRDHVR